MNRKIKIAEKILLLIIILGMSLIFLTGCGYGAYEGTVINKKYTSSYTTTSIIYTGSQVMIPSTQHHPENWRIEIQKEEGRRNKNYLDKCYRRTI